MSGQQGDFPRGLTPEPLPQVALPDLLLRCPADPSSTGRPLCGRSTAHEAVGGPEGLEVPGHGAQTGPNAAGKATGLAWLAYLAPILSAPESGSKVPSLVSSMLFWGVIEACEGSSQ